MNAQDLRRVLNKDLLVIYDSCSPGSTQRRLCAAEIQYRLDRNPQCPCGEELQLPRVFCAHCARHGLRSQTD